jgi:hypothetical protein
MSSGNEELLLSRLYIASPCDADWNAMVGNDRVRACAACKKNVYNISDMTRGEAEAFLNRNGSSECTQFFRRADGTILTDNCPVGLRRIRNAWRKATKVASLFLGLVTTCSAATSQNVRPTQITVYGGRPYYHQPKLKQECLSIEDLCSGKYALKNPEQIFQSKSKLFIREGSEKTDIYELPPNYPAQYATLRAQDFEREEKFDVAEIYFRLALKLESFQWGHHPELKTNTKTFYARMLRKLGREKDAAALELEAS